MNGNHLDKILSIIGKHPFLWVPIAVLVTIGVILLLMLIFNGYVKELNIFGFSIQFQLRKKESFIDSIKAYTSCLDTKFKEAFLAKAKKAKSLVLIGTGLGFLDADFIENPLSIISDGCKLEIYLANPFSVDLERRLIEEDTGEPRPFLRRPGLIYRLQSLVSQKKKMNNSSGSMSLFSLKLFNHYPTFTLMIIDDQDYFFYSYGHALLGPLSPVMQFTALNKQHTGMIGFFNKQYKKVRCSSIDAEVVIDVFEGKNISKDTLKPFAVYFVPDQGSKLYEFISSVLGYDITEKKEIDSPFKDFVGAAKEFGAHMTIADALYFVDDCQFAPLGKEIEYVAEDFNSFAVTFELKKDFPNEKSISLVCKDISGNLEAIHFEMVFRCYRQAVASNYSLNLAAPDRDSEIDRAHLMIKHYRAPYILQKFIPHFSLLTNVPPEKKDRVFSDLEKRFKEQGVQGSIFVKQLCLMKKEKNKNWEIYQRIPLKN